VSATGAGARVGAAGRCCRVQPDLLAVERAFDYLVPPDLADAVGVGTVVRIPLHGRRVRGWVLADHVEPDPGAQRLLRISAIASAGPPPDVVELCRWVAWRWAGPLVPLLRAASAPTLVATAVPPPELGISPASPAPAGATDLVAAARGATRSTVAWPPGLARDELVLALLADEGSTVLVAPDPARSDALAQRIAGFGRDVAVVHAGRPARDRSAAWARARAGACVVVGGRTAALAPVPDLAAIVVLDEGDERLAEERVPTWNAREIAVERATRTGSRVTLVAAAPSLAASEHTSSHLRLGRGPERAGWPRLEAVDRRDEPPRAGLVTDRLAQALRGVLDDGGRALCFLNRRGRAQLLACVRCGELACCDTCGAAMGERDDRLVCHRGDSNRERVCHRCGGTRLRVLRPGVTHVRDEVAGLLPRVPVTEVDAGTDEVAAARVFVGTEALLHRVPPDADRPILLVAFLDFDQELLAPRYLAAEQALSLLARAARLMPAGRGRLLVQTRISDHEVIAAARTGDPEILTAAERPRRRAAGLPPFGGLAELTGALPALAAACAELKAVPGLTVLGPEERGSTARALVRAAAPDVLADALAAVDLTAARALGRLRAAVDPLRV
jgi:primosomal protein N' (replication factor Y) (superfamily II helicase)